MFHSVRNVKEREWVSVFVNEQQPPDNNASWATVLAVTSQLSSWAWPHPTDMADHGFDGATWPMSPCPTPLGTTRSLARSKGSKPAICPRAEVHPGPHCAPLHSPQLRCQGAEGDIPTFCLARLQLQSTPGFGLFWESLEAKRGAALPPPPPTQRGRESSVCLFTMCCRSRGPLQSLTSAASGFERLTVCFCVLQLTPGTHLLVPTGRVCVPGGGRWGWAEENVQNKLFFFLCSPWNTPPGGHGYLIEMCKV